jgi:ribosomal protein L11 methyltransferase
MDFIEIKIACNPDFTDILMAELAEAGFDSFMENEQGFDAYAEEGNFDTLTFEEILERYKDISGLSYSQNTIARQNWNEDWEKNYDPIFIGDQCLIRASFHQIEQKFPYEIIINPKMSFGTGHHETTSQMVALQLEVDHKDKKVLDVGCGTGILAIMASLLGASQVEACDIDEWSVENAGENLELNAISNVKVSMGTLTQVDHSPGFDIILANINRNVLLDEVPYYASLLNNGGYLFLSGFYTQDVADIETLANQHGLIKQKETEKKNWVAMVLQKG